MFKRYFTSFAGAFAMTFALFLGMHFLVKADYREKPKVTHHGPIIISEVREPLPEDDHIKMPEKIKDIVEPMDNIKPNAEKPDNTRMGTRDFPPSKPSGPLGPTGLGLPEGDMQAITKFAPAYPRNMLGKNIEGYVIVQFTVTKTGAVENARILETTHSGFNKPSLRAVEKFKYKPRVIDGQAVDVHNVIEKVSFEIEKG